VDESSVGLELLSLRLLVRKRYAAQTKRLAVGATVNTRLLDGCDLKWLHDATADAEIAEKTLSAVVANLSPGGMAARSHGGSSSRQDGRGQVDSTLYVPRVSISDLGHTGTDNAHAVIDSPRSVLLLLRSGMAVDTLRVLADAAAAPLPTVGTESTNHGRGGADVGSGPRADLRHTSAAAASVEHNHDHYGGIAEQLSPESGAGASRRRSSITQVGAGGRQMAFSVSGHADLVRRRRKLEDLQRAHAELCQALPMWRFVEVFADEWAPSPVASPGEAALIAPAAAGAASESHASASPSAMSGQLPPDAKPPVSPQKGRTAGSSSTTPGASAARRRASPVADAARAVRPEALAAAQRASGLRTVLRERAEVELAWSLQQQRLAKAQSQADRARQRTLEERAEAHARADAKLRMHQQQQGELTQTDSPLEHRRKSGDYGGSNPPSRSASVSAADGRTTPRLTTTPRVARHTGSESTSSRGYEARLGPTHALGRLSTEASPPPPDLSPIKRRSVSAHGNAQTHGSRVGAGGGDGGPHAGTPSPTSSSSATATRAAAINRARKVAEVRQQAAERRLASEEAARAAAAERDAAIAAKAEWRRQQAEERAAERALHQQHVSDQAHEHRRAEAFRDLVSVARLESDLHHLDRRDRVAQRDALRRQELKRRARILQDDTRTRIADAELALQRALTHHEVLIGAGATAGVTPAEGGQGAATAAAAKRAQVQEAALRRFQQLAHDGEALAQQWLGLADPQHQQRQNLAASAAVSRGSAGGDSAQDP
jgi:hypothetical protein